MLSDKERMTWMNGNGNGNENVYILYQMVLVITAGCLIVMGQVIGTAYHYIGQWPSMRVTVLK